VPCGKAARNREKRRHELAYDPGRYAPELLDLDKIAGALGPAIDGWIPELVYRYSILIPRGLCIDWAIMIDVYRVDDDGKVVRRKVERIDICHSEVHVHTFRQSDDPRDDVGRRTTLLSISAGDETKVSSEFDQQLSLLSREWEARVRRWMDG
jgi:hypothetical protein